MMTEREALEYLRTSLPAEHLSAVLEALGYLGPGDSAYLLSTEFSYYVEAKVPWLFRVEADSEAEAEELVTQAVKRHPHLWSNERGAVDGNQQGNIEIISNVYLPDMSEGDDAAEGLLGDLGLL